MSRIIVTFCEGSHDVAFLSKLLKTICYKTYQDVKIKEYPSPLNGIFESSLKNVEFAELKIDEVSSRLIPRKVLKKDDLIVLIYALGGNRQYDRAAKIIQMFIDTQSSYDVSGDEISGFAGIEQSEFSFVFFNDADNDFDAEMLKINTFLKNYLQNQDFEVRHNSFTDNKGFRYGAYLFSEDGKSGTLENHLLKLMQDKNENIFENAKKYYDDHFDSARLMRKKIKCESKIPKTIDDKLQSQYPNKSIITIAGQLQNSGSSQVVAIEYSDYLTLEKIQTCEKAQEIINFMERVQKE